MGGRPLTTTVNKKHLAMIFERSMELLTVVQSRVFTKLNPVKIVELLKLREGQPPRLGIRCADVVSGFYSFLGYTRLTSKEVVQKAVARGVQEGVFGYFAGTMPARWMPPENIRLLETRRALMSPSQMTKSTLNPVS